MSPSAQSKRVASAFRLPEPVLEPLPASVLAFDPGIIHCGVAEFERVEGKWHTILTGDFEPVDALACMRKWIRSFGESATGVITVEGYQLYPGKMQQQGMSRMGTPEVIGAMKWLYLDECWMGESERVNVALYEQGASIKEHGCKSMMAYLDPEDEIEEKCWRAMNGPKKGWNHNSPLHVGKNPHMRDAEAHGWYRIKMLEAQWRKATSAAD